MRRLPGRRRVALTGKSKTSEKPALGYVRVSRVGGREGDGYQSPTDQRETIKRLARVNGLTIDDDDIVEEEDVSGGKKIGQRKLQALVQRVLDGEASTLLVWKVSRYSRSLHDGALIAHQIDDAGGRIIGSDLDTSAPMGKAILGFLLGWAEEERDLRGEDWARYGERALRRGIPVGVACAGYEYVFDPVKVDRHGKPIKLGLRKREPFASQIARAITLRAGGASWSEAARALEGVPTSRSEGGRWTTFGARKLLTNPIYKGILRRNGEEHFFAHLAIVTRDVWEAAQPVKAERKGRQDAGRFLLSGLLRCKACGRKLVVSSTKQKHNGRIYSYYVCKSGRQFCDAPAQIAAGKLEDWVEREVLAHLTEDILAAHVGEPLDVEHEAALEQAIADAKADRRKFLALVDADDEDAQERLAALTAAVSEAKITLDEYVKEAGVYLIDPGLTEILYTLRDVESRRAILRETLENVTVARGADAGTEIAFKDSIPWKLLGTLSEAEHEILEQKLLEEEAA